MNVISYINGDAQITDFPACSARPLAVFVQACNDLLAGPNGYLSPEKSVLALELGWQTVGTADVSDSVVHAWVTELLSSPTWGVVRYVKITAAKVIFDIAELHRRAASADVPSAAEWSAADRAARRVAGPLKSAAPVAGFYAIRAAYQSTWPLTAGNGFALDVVAGSALQAHLLAAGGAASGRIVELTRNAIDTWRRLTQEQNAARADSAPIDVDLQLVGVSA
ncbi:hypothetical protein [uncultured Mycobacterium sp.]|uniref:hypothetical protein n=1 Tax=uncultured Mycobacterium sp. TaxID=171292 RepID=UPI0035CAA3A7